MNKQRIIIDVSPAVGKISGEFTIPSKPIGILTLSHGAGAGMDHAFMVALADALAGMDIATLRFNFPFTENKKGRPDTPAVAHSTIAAAIAETRKTFPKLPLYVAGKSFGGRMSSQLLSAHPHPAVKGIIFFGFPLHPSGKPSTERAEHLKALSVPMLFLQGTKDTLATWELIESVCATLPTATLVKLEGADHSFKAGKLNTIDILARATTDWIGKIN